MASGKTIGQAYVQILPSTKGIAGQLKSALSGASAEAGAEGGASFGSAFSSAVGTAAKVSGAAIAAAATGVVALTKSAVEGYADYEQLVGGVETLFKDSAGIVMQYADNAYKTAGLSANAYMETVTSFSASLLQSLGGDTKAAAEYADLAITDMADNANKMGTSMESIQNAYQGFAKQNYTMLDNLKLGYGGTKQEMQRLLEDAQALSGIEYDINSYADIVAAIHVIQTEMGITGTTAKEASETISGSLASMKASWSNLLVGIADENADFDTLVNNFVESAVTAGGNLIPRIGQAIKGVGKLVAELAPVIAEALPVLVSDVLPSLLDSAVALLEATGAAIVENLPLVMDAVIDGLFHSSWKIISSAGQLISALIEGIVEKLPELQWVITDTLTTTLRMLARSIPDNLDAGASIIEQLLESMVSSVPFYASYIVDLAAALGRAILNTDWAGFVNQLIADIAQEFSYAAWDIFESDDSLLTAIINSVTENIPKLLDAANRIIDGLLGYITDVAPGLLSAGADMLMQLLDGILDNLPTVITGAGEIMDTLLGYFLEAAPELISAGADILIRIVDGIVESLPDIATAATEVVSKLLTTIVKAAPDLLTAGVEMLTKVLEGIVDNLPTIIDTALTLIDTLLDALIENAPTLISAGLAAVTQLAMGIIDNLPKIVDAAVHLVTGLVTTLSEHAPDLVSAAFELVTELYTGIIENLPEILAAAVQIILELVKGLNDNLPLILAAAGKIALEVVIGIWNLRMELWQAGADMIEQIWEGFSTQDPYSWGWDLVEQLAQGMLNYPLLFPTQHVAQMLKNNLGFSEPKEGPLSDFHTYAPDMMALFTQGIAEGEGAMREQIRKSFDFSSDITGVSLARPAVSSDRGQETTTSRLEKDVEQMYRLMSAYFPQLANMAVLLDGDRLVGGTGNSMNQELGVIQSRAQREGYGYGYY